MGRFVDEGDTPRSSLYVYGPDFKTFVDFFDQGSSVYWSKYFIFI